MTDEQSVAFLRELAENAKYLHPDTRMQLDQIADRLAQAPAEPVLTGQAKWAAEGYPRYDPAQSALYRVDLVKPNQRDSWSEMTLAEATQIQSNYGGIIRVDTGRYVEPVAYRYRFPGQPWVYQAKPYEPMPDATVKPELEALYTQPPLASGQENK